MSEKFSWAGCAVWLSQGPKQPYLGELLEVVTDLALIPAGTEVIAVIHDLLHRDEVDNALQLILSTDGELDDEGVGAEHLDDHVLAAQEVSTHTVHLVDKDETRDTVLVGLAPYCL